MKALRRAKQAAPPVDISIEVTRGRPRAYRAAEIDAGFDLLFDNQEEHLRKRFWEGSDTEITQGLSEIREAARNEWYECLDKIAAFDWPGTQFTITNSAGTYLEEIELVMEFPNGVVGIEKEFEQPTLSELLPTIFPPPPIPDYANVLINSASQLTYAVPSYNSHVDWENDEGDRLIVTVSDIDLRPDTPWQYCEDEFVVAVIDDDVNAVQVKWKLTARGHHRSYTGAFSVDVEDASSRRDFVQAVKRE